MDNFFFIRKNNQNNMRDNSSINYKNYRILKIKIKNNNNGLPILFLYNKLL